MESISEIVFELKQKSYGPLYLAVPYKEHPFEDFIEIRFSCGVLKSISSEDFGLAMRKFHEGWLAKDVEDIRN